MYSNNFFSHYIVNTLKKSFKAFIVSLYILSSSIVAQEIVIQKETVVTGLDCFYTNKSLTSEIYVLDNTIFVSNNDVFTKIIKVNSNHYKRKFAKIKTKNLINKLNNDEKIVKDNCKVQQASLPYLPSDVNFKNRISSTTSSSFSFIYKNIIVNKTGKYVYLIHNLLEIQV
ncbi:MAG: hypothetical protein ACOVQ2_01255, partial [Flavobacterium sp.]